MTKLVLSLTLVLTQVAASGGSPLFLCLGHCGAVCIDFGPEACDCCDSTSCGHETCMPAGCRHDAPGICQHSSGESQATALTGVDDDCGCKHVQISAPQHAVAPRNGGPDDASTALALAPTCLLTVPELSVQGAMHSPPLDAMPPCSSLALSASAIMRC